jgi:hypothetical protein
LHEDLLWHALGTLQNVAEYRMPNGIRHNNYFDLMHVMLGDRNPLQVSLYEKGVYDLMEKFCYSSDADWRYVACSALGNLSLNGNPLETISLNKLTCIRNSQEANC